MYEGEFEIIDAVSNQVVGKITKEPATMAEMVTDADSYTINFPPNADAYDKLTLMGLAIMIDYQYFETNANDENKKRRRGGGFGSMIGLGAAMGGGIGSGGLNIRMGGGRKKFNKKRRKH